MHLSAKGGGVSAAAPPLSPLLPGGTGSWTAVSTAACVFLHVLRLGDGTPGMSAPPFIRVFLNNQAEQPFHLQSVGGARSALFSLIWWLLRRRCWDVSARSNRSALIRRRRSGF